SHRDKGSYTSPDSNQIRRKSEMRNLKRVLSMALASVMVLGLTVVGASAANFNDQAEIKHTTAAAVMSAIGVLEGNEKGDFMPDQVLTREQAAKIITYMLMG